MQAEKSVAFLLEDPGHHLLPTDSRYELQLRIALVRDPKFYLHGMTTTMNYEYSSISFVVCNWTMYKASKETTNSIP
jgi:hypothetical protein